MKTGKASRGGHESVTEPDLRLLPAATARRSVASTIDSPPWPALPVPLTSFIGREAEVAAIVAMLSDGARLLTLTGPGGVGKTRLSLRVADEAATLFAGGIAFVSLAAISDPHLVLPAIARALGLRDDPHQSIASALAAYLRPRRLLLVLDNFEQVRPAAGRIAELLLACPDLAVLTTSRVLLRVAGERRVPVAPLGLPEPAAMASLTASSERSGIAAAPAVQLFVARAQEIDPHFALGETNAEAVAAICLRLDGLPLAIELAAARVHQLAPGDVLARLNPALPLLSGGPDDAPHRLRTMRNAIAWSYDLLTVGEQHLFRRLAVFVGGFTLEAAEWVGDGETEGGGAIDPSTPDPRLPTSDLDLVAALVDASLLRRTVVQGESRFAMLETIREFGLERLEASGEAEATRQAHARYVVQAVAAAAARIHGPDGAAVLGRMEAEHDNLRAALAWTIARRDTALALRLALAAWRFWWMRSHLEQARTWLERVLALPDADAETTALRSSAMVAAGYFARVQGDYERAAALGSASLALAQQRDDAHDASAALHLLSLTATDRGELAEAHALLEEGIAIDRSVDYAHGVAYGLSDLGDIALSQGRFADAAALVAEALAIWQARGDAWGIARALTRAGRIARVGGDPGSAAALVCDALTACARLGDKEIAARAISELAAIAVARADLHLAAQCYGSVAALRETIGAPLAPTERAAHEAAVDEVRAGLAKEEFLAAWEAGRALTLDQVVVVATALGCAGALAPAPRAFVPERLTTRERDVLRLVARGWSDKEIAAELGIGRRTVSTHVAALRAKLSAVSRSAAAAIAIRDRLI